MARAIVGNPFENQIPSVAPTASPVDTFVKPVVQKSPFEALSKTLNELEQKASPIFEAERQRRAQNEIAEGERLYQENRVAIGDAVRQGLIEEGASPYVRRGYRISQMNTMSMRYASELENALESQRLYTTGDPDRIEAFISEFQQKFVDDNGMGDFADHEVSEFFGVQANRGNEVFREAWRDRHVAWQREQAYAAFEREVAEATLGMFRAGQTPEERQAALGDFARYIEGRASDANIDGLNNARMIDTILNGVALSVQATGQTDALDVFNELVLGTGPASGSLRVQSRILQIQDSALSTQNSLSAAADDALDTANETARATADQLQLQWMRDPTPENLTSFQQAITALSTSTDEKSTGQAIAMQSALEDFNQALANGGVNQTTLSRNLLDLSLKTAPTIEVANGMIRRAVEAGELTPANVLTMRDRWTQLYDPALGETVGLQFYVGTTPEGVGYRNIYSVVAGDEWNSTEQSRYNGQQAQAAYRHEMTRALRDRGGADSLSMSEIADISDNITQNLLRIYSRNNPDSDLVFPDFFNQNQ